MYFIELQESETTPYPNQMAEFSFNFLCEIVKIAATCILQLLFFQKCDALPGEGADT